MPPDPTGKGRPIRVLRVLSALNVGGTEMRTAELVPRLAAEGTEVHLLPLSDGTGSGPLAGVVLANGGSVSPVPLDIRFPTRFLRVVRRTRPDVVHVDCANFSGVPLTLAALCGVPIRVAHFRGDDNLARSRRRQAYRWIWHRLLRLSATDILGVSPSSLEHGFDPAWREDPRCQVVLNGLDLERLCRPGDEDLRELIGAAVGDLIILTVGRGSAEKRRWLIPPILAALRERGFRFHSVMVGPCDEADDARVRSAAAAAGVADQVHLIGARTDVGALLRQADAVVHPSCLEGMPGGVLEPIALGVGTVAADLPGVRFIAARLPGVQVLPVDASPVAWADAILSAIRFTAAGDRTEAIDRFTRSIFAIDAAVAAHLAIYRRRVRRLRFHSWSGTHRVRGTRRTASQGRQS